MELERYSRLLNPSQEFNPEKVHMTDTFLQLVKNWRDGRAEPRPFADPERIRFGEPPGSPGNRPNAIDIYDHSSQTRELVGISRADLAWATINGPIDTNDVSGHVILLFVSTAVI